MKKAISHILAKLEFQGKREDFKSLTQQGVGWDIVNKGVKETDPQPL